MTYVEFSSENSQLWQLLQTATDPQHVQQLFTMIEVNRRLITPPADVVPRAVLAQAMNMLLFAKNLDAVPEGRAYVSDRLCAGGKVEFDHGALRTVDSRHVGALPRGQLAFKRLLEPLGFSVAAIYPLPRLKMTGYAYCHLDAAEDIAQFFVSELHAEQFSPQFQAAVTRVIGTSKDPLTASNLDQLAKLSHDRALPFHEAAELLQALVGCFAVQHETPQLEDYEVLLVESAEMAWISTEGNSFNHATDRVTDVFVVAEEQRALGRPIKEKVEVSSAGSVRQTAFRATPVERNFLTADSGIITRTVPGAFYEFISRDLIADPVTGTLKRDLRFDSSNAQGIFKMTAGTKC